MFCKKGFHMTIDELPDKRKSANEEWIREKQAEEL
jgi:hypothetical protein